MYVRCGPRTQRPGPHHAIVLPLPRDRQVHETLVDQVVAAGASTGRERAMWARSAASASGGAMHDQYVQERCTCAQGRSELRIHTGARPAVS